MTDTDASATARAAHDLANRAYNLATKNEVRMSSHEEQCAERYQGIIDRLGTLQRWMVGAAVGAIMLLLAMVGTLFVLWQTAALGG